MLSESRVAAARRLHPPIECIHAIVYFAPEARAAYEAAGLKGGWMGYFASRAAALGPVPAEVVQATFYNFHPSMVRRAIPDAWRFASPERVLAARREVVRAALARLLGDDASSPRLERAAALARRGLEGAPLEGRPLFAAHAALPWPDEPGPALWHACTLLREFRGDGHVIALAAAGLDGIEAHVTLVASGQTPAEGIRPFRGWSDEDWSAAQARLRARGLLHPDETATEAGRALRADIEERTDELAAAAFAALAPDEVEELAALLDATARRLVEAGAIPFPNPMGLPPLD